MLTIFYIICALICLALVLCNLYGAKQEERLSGGNLLLAVFLSVVPFLNVIYIIAMIIAGVEMVKQQNKLKEK